MRLAIDASTIVKELLRPRGRALVGHPDLEPWTAVEMESEARHELVRRAARIVAAGHWTRAEADDVLAAAVAGLDQVNVAPPELYAPFLEIARRRIPRDPDDAPTVALALALECGIWTADHDFFGWGLAVWSSEVLVGEVAAA